MIDTAVKIVDRLIQLLNIRREERARYFDTVVEPLYRDAEIVAKDYVTLFKELISRLGTEEDVAQVVQWLELRRLDSLPVRIKIRANLEGLPMLDNSDRGRDPLIKGIWGLLKGGLSLTETGHARLREYGYGDHTVLDLLHRGAGCSMPEARRRYLENARRQLQCIEAAWKDVARGYYDCRNKFMLKKWA